LYEVYETDISSDAIEVFTCFVRITFLTLA